MHNVPMAAHNAIVLMAKKVEDNVLNVMTAPVVTWRLKVAKPCPEPIEAQKQPWHQPYIPVSIAPW